jgi:hypothetical protein
MNGAYGVDVSYSGPIFDGRAQAMTDRSVRDMEHHLASVGADYVRAELERVLRKETPYYRLQVTSTEYPGRTVINDGGVIYGPWLEGTGSRNRTTRFKGYATFRRMAAKLSAEAPRILAPYADALVARINHGS